MQQSPLNSVSITTGTLIRATLVVLFFLLLFFLRNVLLVVLISVVIASAIEPFTMWLCRFRLPRLVAVISIYIVLALLFVGIFYFFVPSLLSDTANFLRAVPSLLETVPASLNVEPNSVLQGANLAQTLSEGIESTTQPSSLTAVFTDLAAILGSFAKGFWDNIAVVFGGIVQFILIVVLSFYLAVQEDGVSAFLRVVTPERHEPYVVGLWKRARHKIGYWMQGQIFLALLVGVLVYLGLMILGIKNALFLGVLAALFEIIPLFGPILSAIPAIGIAYAAGTAVSDVGIASALVVAGWYLIIQQFENHLFYPWVVKKIVGVPPMIVIIALIVGAQLGGFLGILLSVPVAATLMEFFDDLQKRKSLSPI